MINIIEQFDIEQTVASFVANIYGSNASLARLASGHHTVAYKLRVGKRAPLVLRLSEKREHFERDAFVGRRFGDLLPVPRALELGLLQDTSLYYCLTEFKPGRTLAYSGRLRRPVTKDLKKSFIRVMHEISAQSLQETSGYGEFDRDGIGEFDSWSDFLRGAFSEDRVIEKIDQQMHAGQLDGGLLRDVQHFLMTQTSVYEQRHLLHGDYQPHNVLVEDQQITAVIDWGNAKFGDFAYDIAWTSMHKPHIASETEIIHYYADAGFDVSRIEDRIRAAKTSVLISWAMFSNEIGNFENALNDQAQLMRLLRA